MKDGIPSAKSFDVDRKGFFSDDVQFILQITLGEWGWPAQTTTSNMQNRDQGRDRI